jgi:hypothetical protein
VGYYFGRIDRSRCVLGPRAREGMTHPHCPVAPAAGQVARVFLASHLVVDVSTGSRRGVCVSVCPRSALF